MLQRFDPFRELDRMLGAMSPLAALVPSVGGWQAPMDAYRRDGVLHLSLDLPGVSGEDLAVTVDGDELVITAERRYQPDPGDDVLVTERGWGELTRRIRLDAQRYALDAVTARLDAGVLALEIPVRGQHGGPRQIHVQTGATSGTDAALAAIDAAEAGDPPSEDEHRAAGAPKRDKAKA